MTTEFVLQSDADLGSGELRSFFESTDARATAFRPSRGARDVTTELFGFSHRVTVTFPFRDLSYDRDVTVMVGAVLAFRSRFGGRGVLLFNGAVAVMRWSPDEVVFSRDWDDWFEVAALLPLVAGHKLARLRQPLL